MITDNPREERLTPITPKRVSTRKQSGKERSYLEAWEVKAHLIRVFGFGGWDWNVTSAKLAFEDPVEKDGKQSWSVGYMVSGTLTIHAIDGDRDATYTEAAVGSALNPQRGEAHDLAIKSAESDALKRAAINLGNQFGLSLYKDGGSLDDVIIEVLAGGTK